MIEPEEPYAFVLLIVGVVIIASLLVRRLLANRPQFEEAR